MYPPPDVPRRKPRWSYFLVAVGVFMFVLPVIFMMAGMLGLGRVVTTHDYAHDVHEKDVTATQMGIGGTVAIPAPNGVEMTDVASGDTKTWYQPTGDWRIWGVAGPNRNRLAIFTENDMSAKLHRLNTLDMGSGVVRRLFERPGDALWDHAISDNMVVAGASDVAVIADGVGNEQLHAPEAYMPVCDLERVDLTTGATRRFKVRAFESTMAISGDGRYVFYVAGLDSNRAARLQNLSAPKSAPTEGPTPVVFRLDMVSGRSTALFPGWNVTGDPDDGLVLISDYDGNVTVFDLTTLRSRPFSKPNYVHTPLGLVGGSILISRAMQARREDVELTRFNGLPGPRPMPRVVAYDGKGRRIATLVKAFDPRHQASYSPWPKPITKR
ncbi:hypothetical protein [Fimbriimonas ginsengisoli]|uniref:WD40 repeat domain-containing protein n=1 Tax=Fimbriimonas ginsengisoli Gsoil 348 TaxID=661478 RepID=A0A068NYZ6_FIMGI|nr:hypothetical protein [Fimbriimonas ginsengisoli]AIE87689.1 hypothetical protein OP10G_4321 [Fimbriimonas ginsengisoli Gsoil 348]